MSGDPTFPQRVLLLSMLWATSALASFDLDWQAAEGCPPRPEVEALVGATSGKAQVILQGAARRWTMTLNFEGPVRGTRRLVASSCEEVAQAAKLLLRLGSRGALPADPALTPPPLTETETQTALEAVPASSATPEITPWGLAGLIGAALDVGTLPAPSGRLALAVEGHRRAVALILEARIGFPSRFEVNGGSLTVERPLEGQLVGCWAPTLRAFAVGPCAAVSLGWWNLRGSGVSSPKSATVAFAAASAQARASLQAVGGLIISVMAGLRFNLVRLAPFYTDSGTLFTAPLMAGDFQVAAGWRW